MNLYAYVGNGVVVRTDAPCLAPAFKNCTKQQERELRKHLQDVCGNRIGLIPSKWLRKCLRKRCENIVITCADSSDPVCSAHPDWCAYTPNPTVPRRGIVICPIGFDRGLCQCLGKNILHEMVHSCGVPEEHLPSLCEWYGYHSPGAKPCPE